MSQIRQIRRFDGAEVWDVMEWLDPLPAVAQGVLRVAEQSAMAAGCLLAGQVVTVGVLGCGTVGQLMLTGVVRYVPGVSHVSLYAGAERAPIAAGLVDRLNLAGVGFAASGSVVDAVRGANLVIACGDAPLPELRIDVLSPRCLVVNASGVDLPDELVDRVDAVYVDDLGLLVKHRQRHFVRSHLGEAGAGAGRRRGFGNARRAAVRVSGDLHQLSTGASRSRADRVVLVELLGAWPAGYPAAGSGPAAGDVSLRMIANDR